MDSPWWVYLIGFAGIGVYGARILIQWLQSEKSRKVESPAIYWILSSCGSAIMFIYGWLRKDLSIIYGESIGYYVYMWNIGISGLYKKVPRGVMIIQALFPLAILAMIFQDWSTFSHNFLDHNSVVPALLAYGFLSQTVYEARSIYQVVYCYKLRKSILPLGYWLIAVAGSTMIIIYGLLRHDWVLAIGQISILFSIRNLMFALRNDPS